MTKKGQIERINAEKRRLKLIKKSDNNGHIWGRHFRFKARANPTMKAGHLGNEMRTTLHSGIDNPLSFMYNEMQRQNKIQGHRRHRWVRKGKAGLGPRYKVSTRIGKLHHMNVGDRYFEGVDSD